MKVELKNIYKSFGPVKVLKDVQLEIGDSEVHALVGENGAGKSTLMKILTGMYTKDAGNIIIDGTEVHFKSLRDSEEKGIAFIHQELNVLPYLTVVQNLFLGKEQVNKYGMLKKEEMYEKSEEILKMLGVNIDPNETVSNLSVGYQQLIEIARSLLQDAKLIIMDEPTAALTNTEINNLFKVITKLKKEGVSFVYISHRMEEIFEVCDKASVLRDGKFIFTKTIEETNIDDLAESMVGYELKDRYPRTKMNSGNTLLKVSNLNKKGVVKDISFELKAGEVLGFSGLMGSGRTELMNLLFGVDKYDSGEIKLFGEAIRNINPVVAKEKGVGYITEDRKGEGLILGFDITNNLSITNYNKITNNFGVINKAKQEALSKTLINDFLIKCNTGKALVTSLSGGNQQKVVVAKWIATEPKILILDEPTRGVDIGAKREIYKIIDLLKQQGVGIIVVSSEMPEVMGISDRIVIMHEGKITDQFINENLTQEDIIKSAIGGV